MRSPLYQATAAALAVATFSAMAAPQETVKDRSTFIPNRKYAALPGTAVGVLVSDARPVLSLEGRSGPADSYCFSADGASYRWIYLPARGKPQITNLQVPVGAKGEKRVYPALDMATSPGVALAGIKTPYALVRVQVNSGEGSPPGDSFVATDLKPLDGSKEYPIRTAAVIQDLRQRYADYLKAQGRAINDAMEAARKKALQDRKPTGPREQQDVMYVTWMTQGERLRVHFRTRVTDGEYKYAEGGVRRGGLLQPPRKDAPGPPPPPRQPRFRYGIAFGVEFGLAYEVSKQGEVVRTEVLPTEAFRHDLPPPARLRPQPNR
jgi:hypothetical protein